MKGKLLDAAEKCLIDVGYAKTSSLEVCRRAGVSNGALLHHFRTRENLLASTLERLYSRFEQGANHKIEEVEPGSSRVDHSVDVLWSVFDADDMKVMLELWLAAASDKKLRRRVFPVMQEFAEAIMPKMGRLFPDGARDTSYFNDVIDLLLYVMQGMALDRSTFGPEFVAPGVRPLIKQMLHYFLEKRAQLEKGRGRQSSGTSIFAKIGSLQSKALYNT